MSIYKKLKLKEIEPHITKLQGVTYVNEVGFNLLKESLNLNEKFKTNLNNENINVEIATDLVDFKEDLTSLNLLKDDYIETLKKQIEEKDNQIQELHNLIKNNQILLKQEKEVNLLQLEQHLKDVDLKLNNVKEKMEQRKQEKKKGFLKRIFK
ncbi:hypothetical protein [Clostridium botulinum]|uniref:hypothetical protein n=1 Tax=Clostridium botulinum TaxID=1491 RepID=UPI0022475FFF|nr:hypothetical protein [Clostridium botulinum]UZP08578.1 hypothetical protein JYA71_17935 [Clostridium botulinum]